MAALSRLWAVALPLLVLFQVALIEAHNFPHHRHADIAALFRRQDTLSSALCYPGCELGTCGGEGSCPAVLRRRDWLGDYLLSNASEYQQPDPSEIRALRKRLFTFKAGSTNVNDYSGKSQPKKKDVAVYLPAVFNGGESGYYGDPLPTVHIEGDRVTDERAVSQQKDFGNQAFQIILGPDARVHGGKQIVYPLEV